MVATFGRRRGTLAAAVIAACALAGVEAFSQEHDLDALLDEEPSPAGEEQPERKKRAEPVEQPPAKDPREDRAESAPVEETPSEPAPAEAAQTATRPSPRRSIEEIVVTARRREERLQDVPVAVTAFSREQLERYGVADLNRLSEMTPQLFVTESGCCAGGVLWMRGIGSSATTSGFDQAVAINLDGVHYNRANVLAQGYFDLDRVEVLKGPQALFFGKNSPAGVLSLASADPGPELELLGRFGSGFLAGEYTGEAIASGPITDTFGARVAVRYGVLDSYMKNVAGEAFEAGSGETVPPPANRDWPGKSEFLGRLTLKYEPTDVFDVSLKVSGALVDDDGPTQGIEMFSCEALGNAQVDPDEPCRRDRRVRQNDLAPAIAASEPELNDERGALYRKYDAHDIAGTANYRWGPLRLTSVTGYTHHETNYLGDYDLTGSSVIFVFENADFDAFSQELRVLSELDFPLNFLGGIYYQRTDLFFRNLVRLVPLPEDPETGRYVTWDKHAPTQGKTWSGFGQAIWNVVETVELTAGARLTHETKDSFSVNDYLHPGNAALFRPEGSRLSDRFSDDDLSPEITLSWRPRLWDHSTAMLYGAYKEGFKSGGFSNSAILRTNTTVDNVAFASERVSGFEGGLKSTWLHNALHVNVVGYTYEFTDLQVNFFDSASINFDVQNAAGATTTGAEADLQWLPPVEGLTLRGALAYNRARYDDFLSFCYAGQSYGDGCNLDQNGEMTPPPGERQDLSGTMRPFAPEWSGNFGFDYELPLPLPGGLAAGLGATFHYTDRYLLSELGRNLFQDSYVQSDATLRLFPRTGTWEIGMIGRNLSDEHVIFGTSDSPGSGAATGQPVAVLADQVGVVNRPREIGLQATLRF